MKPRSLSVPRRLCFTLSGLALATTLGCGNSTPSRDLMGSDPAPVADVAGLDDATADVADVPADLALADGAGDLIDRPPPLDQKSALYVCVPDGTADMAMCPMGAMSSKMPECPPGCMPLFA
jgi:hypothetical protein